LRDIAQGVEFRDVVRGVQLQLRRMRETGRLHSGHRRPRFSSR
jgi:hypothetical protein